MNILLINHYAGSPNHGMEYRPYHFGIEWKKSGHKVTIVASSFSHVRFSQPNCSKSISSDVIDGIQYIWLRTPKYHSEYSKCVVNMLSFAGQLYTTSLPIGKPHVTKRTSPSTTGRQTPKVNPVLC